MRRGAKKKLSEGMVLIFTVLLLGGCKLSEMRNDSMAEKLMEGDNPSVKERAWSSTDSVAYYSYDTYKELTEKEMLAIADYEYRMVNDVTEDDEDAVTKLSLIFYKEDTAEVYDKFIYKDGERQPESADDTYLSSNKRSDFDEE